MATHLRNYDYVDMVTALNFKRILAALILSFCLVSAMPTATLGAADIPSDFASLLTKQEKEFLAGAGPIRVHNESDWAPFNFNQNSLPKGYSIDYMKLLARKSGLEIRFISGHSWDEFLDMVRKGKLDVMLNIAKSPERQQFLEFTPPYVTMSQMLYTRKDFPAVSSMKDLYGKRFAVPKGFFLHEALKAHPQIEIVEVSDTSAAIRAVSVGKADALFDLMPVVDYITNQLQITNLKVGGDLGLGEGKPIPLHIAVRKDMKILAGILEKGMTRITEEELRKLREIWLPGSLRRESNATSTREVRLDLTEEERAFLAGKQLRLGVDVARPPFEYVDEKGAYAGISADFITAAARRLGIAVVPLKEMKWTEAMEKVKTGSVDVIPKVTPSAEREKFLIFTRPYTTFPSVIVTRKDRLAGSLDDLRGARVGVNKGQIIEASLKRDHPELSLTPFPDIETGLRALATGKCDVYVDNLGAVAYTIETVGLANLRIAASTPYTHDLAFGVRKDWPLLASALDKTLAAMTDQEKTAIRNRWLALKYEAGINWRIVGPVGAALLAVIAFVLFWNRRLRKAIREREYSERKIKAMGEAMADALIMIDGSGKVLFWNQAAEKLFGYSVQEALGMDIHRLTAPAEVREKADGGLKGFSATGKGALFGSVVEITAINRMDETFPVEVNLSPFKVNNEWFSVGTVRDIRERKRAEALKVERDVAEQAATEAKQARLEAERAQEELEAKVSEIERLKEHLELLVEERTDELRTSEERSRLILSSMSEGIFGLDRDGNVTFINQAVTATLGYTEEDLLGRPLHATLHYAHPDGSEFPQSQCPMYRSSQDGKARTADGEVLWRKDGTAVPVEYSTTPVYKEGRVVGSVVSFRDITERKLAQEKLKEHMEDLERFSRLTVNREEKMIQLKEEVNTLLGQMGTEKKYRIVG